VALWGRPFAAPRGRELARAPRAVRAAGADPPLSNGQGAAECLPGTALAAIEALSGLLCVMFLAASILRVLTACFGDDAAPAQVHIAERALPIYTIICALYREAAVVGDLVAANSRAGLSRYYGANATRRSILPAPVFAGSRSVR
jgi:hypothetical protein